MNKKTRASLLALTIIVSQQLQAEPAQKPMVQPKTSYITWKNAGIAAALAGTATAAYIYQDALIDLLSAKSPQALITTEEEKLAIQKEFLALPQAEQDAITAELQKVSGQDNVAPTSEVMADSIADNIAIDEQAPSMTKRSWSDYGTMLYNNAGKELQSYKNALNDHRNSFPELTAEEIQDNKINEAEWKAQNQHDRQEEQNSTRSGIMQRVFGDRDEEVKYDSQSSVPTPPVANNAPSQVEVSAMDSINNLSDDDSDL